MSGEPYLHRTSTDPELEPELIDELTEEEVVAAARAFALDEHCERVDADDEPALRWEH